MTRYRFVCLIATLCTGVASAQVAYVYVPTPKGIYAYDASSAGKLTEIEGSPFTQTSGLMIGSNGKYFITLGTDYVHSYDIASNGAIEKQVSEINTQLYGGSECGTTGGATLDHTGQYVYVNLDDALEGGDQFCATMQTFQISSSGVLTFKGDIVLDSFKSAQLPVVVAGSEKFAYSLMGIADACELTINSFTRESTGTLEPADGGVVNPEAQPGGWYYFPNAMTEDPTNHLAVAITPEMDAPCGTLGPQQLGSFTEASQGELISTNTYKNMPTVPGGVGTMRMSPSGKLLAITTGSGVQMFHFNAASPITEFTGIIGTGGSISAIQWDTDSHLYALNASGKLHVYTATTTSVKEVAGSPYVMSAGASSVLVVSR